MTEPDTQVDPEPAIARDRSATATSSDVDGARQITTRALYRLVDGALVVSGLSLTTGVVLHPTPPLGGTVATLHREVSHVMWQIGTIAGVVGVSGRSLRHRREVGVLGVAGSVLAVLGVARLANAMFVEAFIAPSMAARAPELFDSYPAGAGWEGFLVATLAAGARFGVGFLLLGGALFAAAPVPRWAIVLVVLGGVPFAVTVLLPHAVGILVATTFAIGLAGLGAGLLTHAEPPATEP